MSNKIDWDMLDLTRENALLKQRVLYLEQQAIELKNNGTGKLCPSCNKERMINLTTIDGGIRLCGCKYQESNKLKPGQKSVLERKTGGIE